MVIAAVLIAATAIAVGVVWIRVGESSPWDRAEVSGDGLVVRLHYVGSECEQFRSVDVDETPSAVVLTITTRSFATSCSDVGVPYVATVRLEAPAGDRRLIDGSGSN